jgi:hypothetical protein
LVQEVCNHAEPVALAHRLLLHIRSNNILPSHVIQRFSHYAITSPINGFYSTKFPLWKLGYFLGEEWLQDEVLDALAELVYFKAAITTSSVPDSTAPTFLYLPTSLFNEARVLFHGTAKRQYGPNLEALRQRIQCTTIDHIGFLDYNTNHYSGYILTAFQHLQHGDSLHRAPAKDILPILEWILSGLDTGSPGVAEPGIMDLQGRGGGDGSCAIAAHNFIACVADSTLNRWTSPTSRDVRDQLLRELCIYHKFASDSTVGV